jgi:hypothetical protein
MKGAVVAAEPVPERDDAQRADLVTAGTSALSRRSGAAIGGALSLWRPSGSAGSGFSVKFVFCL